MAPPMAPAPAGHGGGGGLAQSQHSNTPPSPPPSPFLSDIETIKKMVDGLVTLANREAKGTARGMGQDILTTVRKICNAAQNQTGNISLASLRRVVAEEVKAAVNGAQDKRSWATVASQGSSHAQAQQPAAPTKTVPARINKEVLVRGRGMPADLAKRTPQEIVQAVNQVSMKKGAVAARKLPSGDTVVTFQGTASRDWHSTNNGWIKEAFGQQAEESKRTFAVLLKGAWKRDLQGTTEEAFGKEIGLRTVDKVKFRVPKHQEATRATVLVALTSQEEARKACDEGVIWRAQLLDCEPYWAALSPVQCFKCWKWGHTQHYCRTTPLCPRCGTKAHGEGGRDGEAQCPTHNNEIPLRCPVCGGRHPAWSKECPEKLKVLSKAKEAYQSRPRTYEAAAAVAPNMAPTAGLALSNFALPNFSQGGADDDGYQEVSRKRMRGRPTNAASAQYHALRDPQQTRINFELAAAQFASPVATSNSNIAPPPHAFGPTIEPTPTNTTTEPTVTTISTLGTLDAAMENDTVMETIIVADDDEV